MYIKNKFINFKRKIISDFRALSPVIGTILVVGIVVSASASIMFWGVPYLEHIKMKGEADNVFNQLQILDDTVDDLVREGVGTSRENNLAISSGSIDISSKKDQMVHVYSLDQNYDFNVTGLDDHDKNFTLTFEDGPGGSSITDGRIYWRGIADPTSRIRASDFVSLKTSDGDNCIFLKYDLTNIPPGVVIDSAYVKLVVSERGDNWDGSVGFVPVYSKIIDKGVGIKKIENVPLIKPYYQKDFDLDNKNSNEVISLDIDNFVVNNYLAGESFFSLKIINDKSSADEKIFLEDNKIVLGDTSNGNFLDFSSIEGDIQKPVLIVHYHFPIDVPGDENFVGSEGNNFEERLNNDKFTIYFQDTICNNQFSYILENKKGGWFKNEFQGVEQFDVETNSFRFIDDVVSGGVDAEREGNKIFYDGVNDFEKFGDKKVKNGLTYELNSSGIKEEYVIWAREYIPTYDPYESDLEKYDFLSLKNRIVFNKNLSIFYNDDEGRFKWDECSDINAHSLEFFKDGSLIFNLPRPVIRDSSGDKVSGFYKLCSNDNGFIIRILTSYDWLIDEKRVYPVYIDPTTQYFYAPSSSPNNDGYLRKYDSTYSPDGAWDASSAGVYDNENLTIGQTYSYGEFIGPEGEVIKVVSYHIYRSFVFFDTSSIPSDATITSARLYLYLKGKNIDDGYFYVQVQDGQPDYPNSPLENTDYDKELYDNNNHGSKITTQIDSGYNDIGINKNRVNRDGLTKLCLRSDKDIDGDSPQSQGSNNETITFYSNEMGTSYRPKLRIVYNREPDAPSNPSPSDGETDVSMPPTLSVDVSDPDGDSMDVTFRTWSGTPIETVNNVPDGGTASISWDWDLNYNTEYSWYAEANDGTATTTSNTWSFTTQSNEAPVINSFNVDTEPGANSGWDLDNNDVQVDFDVSDYEDLNLYFTFSKGSSARNPTTGDYDARITSVSSGSYSDYDLDWTNGDWSDYNGPVYVKIRAYDGSVYSNIVEDTLANGIDGTPPSAPTSVTCRPDGYDKTGEWTENTTIYLTWNNAVDATSGIKTHYAEIGDNTPDEDAGNDEQDTDTGVSGKQNIYYIRAEDNAGNLGTTVYDTINIGYWISPTTHDDSDYWSNENKAYDDDVQQTAFTSDNNQDLILRLTEAILCDKIRIHSYEYFPGDPLNDIWPEHHDADLQIDVYYEGVWHNIHNGFVSNNTWVEIDIGSTEYVDAVRISTDGLAQDEDLIICEFDFHYFIDITDPISSIDIDGYWKNEDIQITVSANDPGSGIKKVDLYYAYSSDNISWNTPTQFGSTDTSSPYTWSFNFPDGEGYYRFYSVAEDNENNIEDIPNSADNYNDHCGYETTTPTSKPYTGLADWTFEDSFTITADADDIGDVKSDVKKVELLYQNSSDGENWNNNISLGIKTSSEGFSWSFTADIVPRYYKFRTIATDNAGNIQDVFENDLVHYILEETERPWVQIIDNSSSPGSVIYEKNVTIEWIGGIGNLQSDDLTYKYSLQINDNPGNWISTSDTTWKDTLGAGDYIFRVKACLENMGDKYCGTYDEHSFTIEEEDQSFDIDLTPGSSKEIQVKAEIEDLVLITLYDQDTLVGKIWLVDMSSIEFELQSSVGTHKLISQGGAIAYYSNGGGYIRKNPGFYEDSESLTLKLIDIRPYSQISVAGEGSYRVSSRLVESMILEYDKFYNYKIQIYGECQDVWVNYFSSDFDFVETDKDFRVLYKKDVANSKYLIFSYSVVKIKFIGLG